MLDLKLDSSGDLVIENGDLVLIDGDDELRQALWITLSVNHDEWFLDGNFGLDYKVFMKKDYSEFEIINAVENALYYDERIVTAHIEKVELNNRTRELYVEGYVTDVKGSTVDVAGIINIG